MLSVPPKLSTHGEMVFLDNRLVHALISPHSQTLS